MIISKDKIIKLIESGKVIISPMSEIKEASIKLHFFEKLVLKPKGFVVTKTKEKIKLSPRVVGLYDGYTHLARKGVTTHLGSMLVDSDVNGQLTLEIFNASDNEVVIEKDDRCGQLILMEIEK